MTNKIDKPQGRPEEGKKEKGQIIFSEVCLSLVPACHVSRLQMNSISSRSAVSQPFWHQGLVL